MTKEKLSDWALRLSRIAANASDGPFNANIAFPHKFLLGMIRRQAILLSDVGKLLATNPIEQQQSTFILCRCLVDDFLLVLYLKSKGFAKQEFINHTAKALEEQLKERSMSKDINYKYFQGKNESMFTNETIKESEDIFYNNPNNHTYLSDAKKRKFIRSFPSTRELVESLPIQPIFAANAGSFVTWKYLSNYIHYSILTFQKDTLAGVREFEMEQIREVLYYAHNTIIIAGTALNEIFALPIPLIDPTNVGGEITEGYVDLSEAR